MCVRLSTTSTRLPEPRGQPLGEHAAGEAARRRSGSRTSHATLPGVPVANDRRCRVVGVGRGAGAVDRRASTAAIRRAIRGPRARPRTSARGRRRPARPAARATPRSAASIAATKASARVGDAGQPGLAVGAHDVADRGRDHRLAGREVLRRLGRADEAGRVVARERQQRHVPARDVAPAAPHRTSARGSGCSRAAAGSAGSILATGPTITNCQSGRGRGQAAEQREVDALVDHAEEAEARMGDRRLIGRIDPRLAGAREVRVRRSPEGHRSARRARRELSILTRREQAERILERLAARAGVDLAPTQTWLLARYHRDPSLDLAALAARPELDPAFLEAASADARCGRARRGAGRVRRNVSRPLTAAGVETFDQLTRCGEERLAELLAGWEPGNAPGAPQPDRGLAAQFLDTSPAAAAAA